jgi:hypothetical protein
MIIDGFTHYTMAPLQLQAITEGGTRAKDFRG